MSKFTIRRVLVEAGWVAFLTLATTFPMLGLAHNFQHPELTQMQVLLGVRGWHWMPFTAYATAAWAIVLTVRALRAGAAKRDER